MIRPTIAHQVQKPIGVCDMTVNVSDTMERLDKVLDDVDHLIGQLPIPSQHKKRLSSHVYDLWMDVEEAVELVPADFPN